MATIERFFKTAFMLLACAGLLRCAWPLHSIKLKVVAGHKPVRPLQPPLSRQRFARDLETQEKKGEWEIEYDHKLPKSSKNEKIKRVAIFSFAEPKGLWMIESFFKFVGTIFLAEGGVDIKEFMSSRAVDFSGRSP